jgi:hypothetical protein
VQIEEGCKVECLKHLTDYKVGYCFSLMSPVPLIGLLQSLMVCVVQACVERIKADESGEAHCTGQYFDYWRCVDKCVSVHGDRCLFMQP